MNQGITVPYTTLDSPQANSKATVYLLVDGIQGYTPKQRCIYSPEITFDKKNGTFRYGENQLTTEDVFGDTDDTFSRELLFRRLDIYQDDVPKKQ
jgi:hypothetical protein